MNQQINICEVVYSAVEPTMPDQDGEFNELMQRLRHTLDRATFEQIEAVCNCRVAAAQEGAFKLGWELRGRI
jgi:hypothetical protein